MALARLQLQDGSFLLLQDGGDLLLQDSSVASSITFVIANAPDEASSHHTTTIYAEATDDVGSSLSFTGAPKISLWRMTAAGTRADEVDATMTQVGATHVYSYDWTPTTNGTYSAFVVGTVSATVYVDKFRVSIRSKFDPVALATEGVLVARFD